MVTGSGSFGDCELAMEIRQQIEQLKAKVGETGIELDRCRQEQEAFSVEYYTFRDNTAKFENMQQQVKYSICLIIPNNFMMSLFLHHFSAG